MSRSGRRCWRSSASTRPRAGCAVRSTGSRTSNWRWPSPRTPSPQRWPAPMSRTCWWSPTTTGWPERSSRCRYAWCPRAVRAGSTAPCRSARSWPTGSRWPRWPPTCRRCGRSNWPPRCGPPPRSRPAGASSPTHPAPARCCSPRPRAYRWIPASGPSPPRHTHRPGRRRCAVPGPACAGTWTPPRTSPPPRCSAWVGRRRLSSAGCTPRRWTADPPGRVCRMQGTVASFDPSSRSGTLLLDDGTRLDFPPAAFDASGLRLLRLGQRVHVERTTDGQVSRVAIPTMQ
ncbi:hypothetical protein CIK06_06915 [Plantactinospora sp. KBS50]|nr:hypothetical protein CIK06_06915 [Plantactinospora sp. KBS50]